MEKLVKNWWILPVLGIILIICGIFMFTRPGITFEVLAYFMATYFLVRGVFEIGFAFSNNKMPGWGWRLTGGILDLIIGIFLILTPGMPEIFIIFITCFWVLFYGISLISVSFDAKNMGISDWGLWLVLGIIITLISCSLIFSPGITVGFIVSFVAISAIFMGIIDIYMGYKLKKLEKKLL